MKTISLKIPDDIYEKVERYRKLEGKNKTSFFLKILEEKIKEKERSELAEQLKKEIEADRKLNQEIINEYDHLSWEGLEKKMND